MAVAKRPGVHVFFDSTEVYNAQEGSANLGRLASPELAAAAQGIGARLYVVDLVIEEFANKRLRELQKTYKDATAKLAAYVNLGALPDEDVLRQRFYEEISREVARISEIVPTREQVALDAIIAMANEEVARAAKKKDLGLSDAMILLASLRYAAARGLRDVWFVSNDGCFDEELVSRVASPHGIECRFFRHTSDAIEWMKDLAAAHLSSLEDEFARGALAFVRVERRAILDHVNSNPPGSDQIGRHVGYLQAGDYVFGAPSFSQHTATWVSGRKVEVMAAFPTRVTRDGAESQVTFHGRIEAEVRIDEHRPVTFLPYYTLGTYGPLSNLRQQGRAAEQSVVTVELPMVGQGRAIFRGGVFVRPLHVDSVSVTPEQRPTGRLR